jgi:hypothetical protein
VCRPTDLARGSGVPVRAFGVDVLKGLGVGTLIGVILLLASISRAQDPALVLARSMVAEANWRSPSDHVAIAYVIQKRSAARARASGVSLEGTALQYVSAFKVENARTRWVRALNLDAVEPEGWPARLSWTRHRPLWLEVLERARAFLRGELVDPCRGLADHWGGPMDVAPPHWVRLDCGDTLNTFYSVRPLRPAKP